MTNTPFGGFVKNPPKDCPKKAFFIVGENETWIDMGICVNCPNKKTCEERKNSLTKKKTK